MDFRYKPAIRIISLVTLLFFSWTFCGMLDIAYAIKNSDQQSAISYQQKENNQKSSQGSIPTKQKPEEKFQKAIENIEQVLTDTVIDTDTKKNKLKTKKEEIEAFDTEIKKQFAETEKKLKDKGLPKGILERHYNFVKKYEDNLNELKTNLDAINKHSAKSKELSEAIEKTKKFLQKIKPPKKHKPLDPNKLPHRTVEPVFKEPRTKPEQFLKDRDTSRITRNELKDYKNPSRITHHQSSLLLLAR
ncbi:MAG: hypothetical protein FJ241_06100 [Nitrospira sp.]|nr:hypothetical protein [Nitrospira sp.]